MADREWQHHSDSCHSLFTNYFLSGTFYLVVQIFSDSDDCSTGTPGPMVEDTDTFFR